MADFSLTRRSILSAMAVAPIAISAPAAANSSGFAAALAAYNAALQTERDFDRTVYEPAYERFEQAVAAIPHETVIWEANPNFAGEVWSTAQQKRVSQARYFLDPAHTVPISEGQEPYHRACVALVAADDRRQQAIARARAATSVDAFVDESDRLMHLTCAARAAVIGCPINSAAELAQKIAFITELEQWEYEATQQAIAADVDRLARGA